MAPTPRSVRAESGTSVSRVTPVDTTLDTRWHPRSGPRPIEGDLRDRHRRARHPTRADAGEPLADVSFLDPVVQDDPFDALRPHARRVPRVPHARDGAVHGHPVRRRAPGGVDTGGVLQPSQRGSGPELGSERGPPQGVRGEGLDQGIDAPAHRSARAHPLPQAVEPGLHPTSCQATHPAHRRDHPRAHRRVHRHRLV